MCHYILDCNYRQNYFLLVHSSFIVFYCSLLLRSIVFNLTTFPLFLFVYLSSLCFHQCVENLESILRSDKAVVYWLRSGCMHLDREGPEIVKPCPAHAICAWVPNLFADVGIISPRNSLAPLCPRDFKYLPRIPRKPATATTL